MERSAGYEARRLIIQADLDQRKTKAERNRLGQFATSTALASDIVTYGTQLLHKDEPIRFLDPALGTGSFYSALLDTVNNGRIETAQGFELDKHYADPAKKLWQDTPLKIQLADFTVVEPPKADSERYNLLICNPPYVRHHHIINSQKVRLQSAAEYVCGVGFSGLSGLYCYFLVLSHGWINEDGIAGWLMPSEFMDVNYGQALKFYLLNRVTLLRLHRFDPKDVQFEEALVSSAVVWYRKKKPGENHIIEFTYGGTLTNPGITRLVKAKTLRTEEKWSRYPALQVKDKGNKVTLSNLFNIKRGLATGDNRFFILTRDQIEQNKLPMKFFKPILPSPRFLPGDEVPADNDGNPDIDRQSFLLDCDLSDEQLKVKFPSLWSYLDKGKPTVANRYLCKSRKPWYAQEKRLSSQFVCTYMGRGNLKKRRPFRFILNHSQAVAPNVYLMLYPKPFFAKALSHDPNLAHKIWLLLNQIPPDVLLSEARVYGGGLYKLEPKELGNIPAGELSDFVPQSLQHEPKQMKLFSNEWD
jgi:adenine-specific DNA-methyltransferase